MNIRRLFKSNCGSGALYLGSELKQRGEYNTVLICFEMVPEGRKFNLDGVIHEGDTPDEQLRNAVLKIAARARSIREILAAPDGRGSVVMNGH